VACRGRAVVGETDDAVAVQSTYVRLHEYDWLRIKAEADGIAAIETAREHRQHIARRFYDCPPAMRHRGLGEMYVTDERFAAHYDAIERGLAQYVRRRFRRRGR
jgi:MerR family transcriptional regulator, thiopeptide resistance regulator